MSRLTCWAVLGLACGAGTAAAQSDGGAAPAWRPADAAPFPPQTRTALEAAVVEARAGGAGEGLSVAVLHGGQAWLEGFGLATVTPPQDATPTTSYRIGSLTKTFTAVAALRLAEEGRLPLDADVRTLVPRFPPRAWPVTPRQLLGHTGGVGWYRSPKDAWTTAPTTTAQALDLFRNRPLVFQPGTQFLYSSFGYVLLGAAVEKAAGEPFAAHLERTLWGPLGLSHTGLEADEKTQASRATGYRLEKGRLEPARLLDLSSRFSSGGLRSTAEDLARWAHALLARRVVREATWREMTTPGVTSWGEVTDYGLGLAVYPVRGRKVLAHSGGVPGASALLLLMPDEDFAVVLLSNLQGQTGLMELAVDLSEVVLDGGLPQRGWYSASRADEVAFDGMRRVVSHGLVRYADVAPPAGAEVEAAFTAVDHLFAPWWLAGAPEHALAALRDAYHPRAGRVSAVAGAEMARLLAARGLSPAGYRLGGPAQLFADYARACAEAPCPYPLSEDVAAYARRLDAEWRGTPPELLRLRRESLPAATGLGALLAALEARPSHVDLVEDLTRLAWAQRAAGRLEDSRATLRQSARLHPASPRAALALAFGAALDGDVLTATVRLEEAAALGRGAGALTRESVKGRAEALAVHATPAAARVLDGLLAQAKLLLPSAEALRAARLAGPMHAAPGAATPAARPPPPAAAPRAPGTP
ncbi:MAG: beta-lactamase family protein [Myxococcales bacterium]|nr:beta-lactamase family protein [Myxococcales bacterium]